jgi:poly(3-hydroxybutyrate) depolymerase
MLTMILSLMGHDSYNISLYSRLEFIHVSFSSALCENWRAVVSEEANTYFLLPLLHFQRNSDSYKPDLQFLANDLMVIMSIFKIFFLFLTSLLPVSIAAASQKPIQRTPGCGKAHGDLSEPLTMESNGVPRQFLVYVPESYQKEQATGLIMSSHGYGKDMWNQQEISRFNDSTFNPDMIAVFPQGLDVSDLIARIGIYNCPARPRPAVNHLLTQPLPLARPLPVVLHTTFLIMQIDANQQGEEGKSAWEGVPRAAPKVQDKRFTTDLLTYLRNNFCIDDSRIYASGKSDGGGFVGTLACSPDHGKDFAAFAAASGAFYTDASDASPCYLARSPLPILEFHGTADKVIPYVGGHRHKKALPGIPEWLARWAGDGRNGCAIPMSNVTEDGDRVWHTTYLCDGKPMVQGFLVEGMGHVWPSREYNDGNKGNDFAPIEGTSIMMDFFRNNTKP